MDSLTRFLHYYIYKKIFNGSFDFVNHVEVIIIINFQAQSGEFISFFSNQNLQNFLCLAHDRKIIRVT